MTTDPLLHMENVTAGYGNTTVLHDVDIAVEDGQIACLIGPNGSGKSMLMKSIYGFADVMGGTVTFGEQDITGRSPQANLADGMSYVLQDSSVFPRMTVHENMLMCGYVFEDDDRAAARAEELYDEFPLWATSAARTPGPSAAANAACSNSPER